MFSMPMVMLLPALVKQDLGAGPAELGILLGLLGVGAVVGSLSVVAFSGFKYKGAAVMLAALLDGVMVMVLGFSQSLVGAGVALAFMGIFQAVYLAMIQTILQLMVPNRLRGRVLSIWMLGWGLTPVGLLPMSALAEAASTPFAMVLSGGIGVAVAVAVMVLARQLWTLDPEAEMEGMEESEGGAGLGEEAGDLAAAAGALELPELPDA
jgi:sugar phosphate permease